MYNDLFSIGPLTVHGYGLMIAIGIIVAYLVAEIRAKKLGEDPDIVFDMTVRSCIGGAVGAKLLYIIVEARDIFSNPHPFKSMASGFVVYGGIIGGIICCILYCKRKKLRILYWFDLILPEIAIAQGFGRLGCFLAGCCYGARTDSAFHIIFKNSDFAPNHVPLYPTQLMSSAGDFLNFILIVFVIGKIFKKDGVMSSFYLIFYSIGRFIVEIFRGDLERGMVGKLSTSQFISIFSLIAGVALLIICLKRKDATPAPECAEETEAVAETEKTAETEEASATQTIE